MITITATLDIHDPSCLGVANSSLTVMIQSSVAVAQSIAAVCLLPFFFLSFFLFIFLYGTHDQLAGYPVLISYYFFTAVPLLTFRLCSLDEYPLVVCVGTCLGRCRVLLHTFQLA